MNAIVTAEQAAALAKYGREYECASAPAGHILKHAVAVDSLRRARLGLTLQQVAALDFVAGQGLTVDELARKAGRDPDTIADIVIRASKRLVDHYAEHEDAVPPARQPAPGVYERKQEGRPS